MEPRYTCNGKCVVCSRANSTKRRLENPEYHKAIQNSYASKNRRKINKKARASYRKNRTEKLKAAKRHREANREQYKEASRRYYASNKKRVATATKRRRAKSLKKFQRARRESYARNRVTEIARQKIWSKANPESMRIIQARSRIKRLSAKGRFTIKDVRDKLKKQKGICIYCPTVLIKGYHIDHKKPLSRGGSNWPRNLQLTCPTCNLRKSSKTHSEFMRCLKVAA